MNGILPRFIDAVKPESSDMKKKIILRATMKPDNKLIASRIKEAREALGYTQAELADSIELTQGGVNKIENGKAALTIENLYKLSEALRRPIAWLLGIGTEQLSPDEVEWLEIFRETPPEERPTLLRLFGRYKGRVRRKR